ncbi:MAG TPA: hypothetical protein VGM44_01720 [Polyangiaceae bacterium]|jgi:ABC-type phosphate transport system substrate-binding protein
MRRSLPHRFRLLLLSGVIAFALAVRIGFVHAESTPEFRLIVHPDNPNTSLSRDFVTDAFLKRTTRWGDGEAIHVVDQRADAPVRRAFSEHVLGRSVAAVKSYWQQRIFSGRDLPPPELESDDAVASYVSKHRGALGYVSGNFKLEHVKAATLP